MLGNNDTVIVHVGDSNPQQQLKDSSVMLGDEVSVYVTANHQWEGTNSVEESTVMEGQIIVQVVPAIPQLADSSVARIRQSGYNALSKDTSSSSDYEHYTSNEMIQFSDAMKSKLNTANYPIYLNIEFDNEGMPMPVDVVLHIPASIESIFASSYKVVNKSGNMTRVSTDTFDQVTYNQSLSDFIVTSVVV